MDDPIPFDAKYTKMRLDAEVDRVARLKLALEAIVLACRPGNDEAAQDCHHIATKALEKL